MMKWLKIEKQTRTSWDSLFDLWVVLDKVDYDLDSPSWYWEKWEWNKLHIDRVAVGAQVKRLQAVVDREEYPSCLCDS